MLHISPQLLKDIPYSQFHTIDFIFCKFKRRQKLMSARNIELRYVDCKVSHLKCSYIFSFKLFFEWSLHIYGFFPWCKF
jgi:hypothetical protein